MTRVWSHLTPSVVKEIHQEVIAAHGGLSGTRDETLLESAVAATQATAWRESVFKDGVEFAAAYLFYLCRNHPFLDGNKRTALAACLVFLERNGLLYPAVLDVEAWEMLVVDIAASRLNREETTKRLRALLS